MIAVFAGDITITPSWETAPKLSVSSRAPWSVPASWVAGSRWPVRLGWGSWGQAAYCLVADQLPSSVAVSRPRPQDVRPYEFGTEDAWVWENGTYQSLPELAPTAYSTARGINLAGHIVGSSHGRAVLWRRQ